MPESTLANLGEVVEELCTAEVRTACTCMFINGLRVPMLHR